jgi:hypothetical protein
VAMVVATTMKTAAAYVDASTTGRPSRISVAPIPAKISPTSPRGIIPSPTVRPETPLGTTTAQASFPTMAARVRATANPNTEPLANDRTSTSIPMRTKKTGTSSAMRGSRVSCSGRSPRSTWPLKWTSSSTRPAANAPTMGASPDRSAR